MIWGNLFPQSFKPNLNYKRGGAGHLLTRLKEVKERKDLDILFLGSSHAYRGFDTRLFENVSNDVFNLGSSSQTPIQTEILLKRYLSLLKPKMVVYEVYPEIFTMDGVESALDLISNDTNDRHSLTMALNINHPKVYNTLIFGVLDHFFGENVVVEDARHGNDVYIPGGFVQKDLTPFKHAVTPTKSLNFNTKQLKKFEEVLAILERHQCRVVLVFAPVTKEQYRTFGDMKTFDKKMRELGEYYNFNDLMNLDDSVHFYDAHHLNQKGVEIFNKQLIELLF